MNIPCKTSRTNRVSVNLVTIILFFAGFGLLVAGLIQVRQNQQEKIPDGPWLVVAPLEIDLKDLQPHEPRLLNFELKNVHPTESVRILGASDYCGALGCVSTKGLPVTVPPLSVISLNPDFLAGEAGEFKIPYSIFTDAPGLSEISLNLTGKVIGSTAVPHYGNDQSQKAKK